MTSQYACHVLHRIDARTHRTRTPLIEKLPGPPSALVLPEKLKFLFEQVRPNRSQIVLYHMGQIFHPANLTVRRALQKQPAAPLERRLFS